MSTLPFAIAVPTLKKKILTMPNMSQGIIKESLTSQEATKKDASIKESLLRSKKILCPILANRQDFTNKRKTLLEPHPSR